MSKEILREGERKKKERKKKVEKPPLVPNTLLVLFGILSFDVRLLALGSESYMISATGRAGDSITFVELFLRKKRE